MKRVVVKTKTVPDVQTSKTDDLEYWAELEAITTRNTTSRVASVKGRTIARATIRTQALEWLRLESIRLAYKGNPGPCLQMAQEQIHDVRLAFGKDRDQLIAWPPRKVGWVYPSRTPDLTDAFCFEPLPDNEGATCKHVTGTLEFRVDPSQPERAVASLRKFLAAYNSKRATVLGKGGKACNLLRLREALLVYEYWVDTEVQPKQASGPQVYDAESFPNKPVMRGIGERTRSCRSRTPDDGDKLQKRGHEIIGCAGEMLRTALEINKSHERKERVVDRAADKKVEAERAEIWEKALVDIQRRVSPHVFANRFAFVRLEEIKDSTAYLRVPNKSFGNWFSEDKPYGLLLKAISAAKGEKMTAIKFEYELQPWSITYR